MQSQRGRVHSKIKSRSLLTTVGADVAQQAATGRFEARRTVGAFAVIETVSVSLTLERCNKRSVDVSFTLEEHITHPPIA